MKSIILFETLYYYNAYAVFAVTIASDCCSFIVMCDKKRIRSPNWLRSEKHLLLDLIEKHFGVIECKKTDQTSMNEKIEEWKILAEEYNSLSKNQTNHCYRSQDSIKSQWECMKKAAKREVLDSKMHILTTGEQPDNKEEDPVMTRVISILNITTVNECMSVCQPVYSSDLPEELQKKKLEELHDCISKSKSTTPTKQLQKKRLDESDKSDPIKDMDLEIKREILKQERIKTRILLLELRLKRRKLRNET